jgi:hypothetical protein
MIALKWTYKNKKRSTEVNGDVYQTPVSGTLCVSYKIE